MKNKSVVMLITASALLFFAGIILLLESVGTAFSGAFSHWYIMLIGFLACMSAAYALVAKAPLYVLFACVLGGLFVMLLIPVTAPVLTHAETYPVILLFLGTGLIVTNFLSKKIGGRLTFFKSGVYITVAAAVLLISAITDSYIYTVPALLFATAVFTVGFVAVRRRKDKKVEGGQVLYVEPNETGDKEID